MSKKILITILMGLFIASGAMASDMGDIAKQFKASGHLAGTIINPEGEGDALIFPYYDVRPYGTGMKEQDTYFCIINTSHKTTVGGVAAKLRFREWDKSLEVFDAEIWLSLDDVWCASISRNTTSGYAKITSNDYVITSYSNVTPSATETFTLSTPLSAGFDFFWPTGYPAISSNLMGYFEVIGSERTENKAYGTTTNKVTRRANGITADCPNTLAGYAYIVRVGDGVAMGYNATAFANFAVNKGSLFSGTGTLAPDLSYAEDTIDQIEFLLSKKWVYAGYSIESIIGGEFSLVMTFPTKHYHFDKGPYYSIKSNGLPWTVAHMNKPETIGVKICDRSENCLTGGWWSPPGSSAGLPYEVSILSLYKGTPPTVPAAGIRDNVTATTSGYETGWVGINFAPGTIINYNVPINIPYFGWFDIEFSRYNGLPVLSLAIQEFQNGAVGGYYGEILPAFYTVDWVPAVPQI